MNVYQALGLERLRRLEIIQLPFIPPSHRLAGREIEGDFARCGA
jgi:hypothetical protein